MKKEDINYMNFEITKSEHITEYIKNYSMKSDEDILSDLIKAGYGKQYVSLHLEDRNSDTIFIDNDPSDGIWIEPFLITDLDGENDSDMRAILKDLIRFESASDLDNE